MYKLGVNPGFPPFSGLMVHLLHKEKQMPRNVQPKAAFEYDSRQSVCWYKFFAHNGVIGGTANDQMIRKCTEKSVRIACESVVCKDGQVSIVVFAKFGGPNFVPLESSRS